MPVEFKKVCLAAAMSASLVLSACSGDDGDRGSAGVDGTNGSNGTDGVNGDNGLVSLIHQQNIAPGHEECLNGGVQIDSGLDQNSDGALAEDEINETSFVCNPTRINEEKNFNRIASFLVCSQIDDSCDTDTETAAEIVAASVDGMTLIYSDSPAEQVGFVNIADPANPIADGVLGVGGEPTSVAVKGAYVLAGVNTSQDFVNVSGFINVIDIDSRESIREISLNGQPDSVAVSPDGNYAVVVIENERDEDLGDGIPPQLPAGFLVIADISDADPENWSTSTVDITGLADLFPGDPEPEYVDINSNNIAVVTLQENNHIVLVDLADGSIVNDFSAGDVDLVNVDLTEGALKIDQSESQDNVVREPDGVSWINNNYFATADEGDMDGGSRGFTIFDLDGNVVWTAGNTLDHMTARLGHYPDKRSGNKGNEPENVEMGVFGDDRYLFVNSERSSLVFVYDVADPKLPALKQVLPAAAAPEGGLAIPSRNLLVVASEEDNRGDKLRSALNIYSYQRSEAQYPTLYSVDRNNGTPIPWAAMSGLVADNNDANILYSVEDSFYDASRIFTIRLNDDNPARLIEETQIVDSNDVFAALTTVDVDDSLDDDAVERVDVFDDVDLSEMINDDKTINIDPEGIAKASDGGFWVASEGSGTIGDSDRPINSLNFIFKTDAQGIILDVVTLPTSLNNMQLRFGFEGVSEWNGKLIVAFQRAWGSDANPRIGIYDIAAETWDFVFYPLETASSQNGGWVGLSDITSMGDGRFLVLERDNQGGPDASIKRLYLINLDGVAADSTVTKTLVRDLMADLSSFGGLTAEKIEGSALTSNGDVYIINDNDGVDDNSGETQLINLGNIVD